MCIPSLIAVTSRQANISKKVAQDVKKKQNLSQESGPRGKKKYMELIISNKLAELTVVMFQD